MALTVSVAKEHVDRMMKGLWNINLRMVIYDNTVEVFSDVYSARYRPGDSIEAKEDALTEEMQADIDKYKSEQTIYNAAELDQAVVNIGNDLVV